MLKRLFNLVSIELFKAAKVTNFNGVFLLKATTIIAAIVFLSGCASIPRWVNKTPDTAVYYVGVGSGNTYNSAEVNAHLDMSAFINGTELDAVVEYFQ